MRRESGESYQDFLTKRAQASGIETPARTDLARIDRKRTKKGSNDDWTHPHDPDAKITRHRSPVRRFSGPERLSIGSKPAVQIGECELAFTTGG